MRAQRWFLVFVALFFGAAVSVVLLSNPASSDVKTPEENDMSDERLTRGCGGACDFPKTKEERKKVLSELQYQVTQEDGTERAFANEYWNNKAAGIYVDVISGEPLFSSTHKFDSGTGWPSFYKPLVSENIVEKEDRKFFMNRTEVRSLRADSHLGHVFPDGPKPTGLRYCINSAALRFVPVEKLEEEGYREYLALFLEESEPKNAEVGSSESKAD